MFEKIIIGAIGVAATIAILYMILQVVLLIGGVCGTYRIFSTRKTTWQGLHSPNEVTRCRAWEQVQLNGASLLFLGLGLTIFL